MRVFIPVDISSIEKNKDAGATVSCVKSASTIEFYANKLPAAFIDGVNCILMEYRTDLSGRINQASGYIIDPDILKTIPPEQLIGVNIAYKSDHVRIEHMHIPEYSYQYENVKFKCQWCGCIINSDEVYNDEDEDCNLETDICPNCHAANCGDIVYEPIEEALKRELIKQL